MTIGPEPIKRTDFSSLRSGMLTFVGENAIERLAAVARKALDQSLEAREQVARVVRARRGLRMVLYREKRRAQAAQSLDGLIVEIDVRKRGASRHGFGVNRETVVLRGDLDAARAQIHHRMIRAVMAEAELVGPASQRQGQNLMTETN